ncbi:NADP-dependent alcohol dehydrogenase, putative [Entamoeba invadens IP1]|uniref:NADP-dependent alcohol dehydrogenase, putative n=1 Tax=Entamoeba invadens IP1 TaxID=370355 RepID=A0A0A1TVA4_ENTIV|nr:NADP-dependent alcohol dehydrogenase, putative [Entamoeba invadens IP1]ELP84246.1 NADP-dependent alcohol dehydrogenase, putative [Entamoeba invadens IP1]|eukprot:XP_004183592.1 NADP-dependent alcohol dehydrogenase, putative [Entamoeba invadens IP1]
MRGFAWRNGTTLISVEKPGIQAETDVIVKMHYASICGSDLHIIKGKVPRAKEGVILGHEGVGEIVAVGGAVKRFTVGDLVSINCITHCGQCWYCTHGYINNCENGGWELGCRQNGTFGEYVRVMHGDHSLNKVQKGFELDCLFVGDILSSGFFGCELGEVKKNDFVAVIGCGPVGMCSMLMAKMLGAKVVGIDIKDENLAFAKREDFADFTFNPRQCNVEEEIKKLNFGRGVDCVIENAGSDDSFEMAWKIARPNGVVSLVAMYESDQKFQLPLMYGKNLIFKTGGVDATHCDDLIKMIEERRVSTMKLITHRFKFDDFDAAMKLFMDKPEFCIKVCIDFQ